MLKIWSNGCEVKQSGRRKGGTTSLRSEAWNNYITLKAKKQRDTPEVKLIWLIILLSFFFLKLKSHDILYIVADRRPTPVLCRRRCGLQLHTAVRWKVEGRCVKKSVLQERVPSRFTRERKTLSLFGDLRKELMRQWRRSKSLWK